MEVNIFQVDAFSSRPFGGNPTIVVLDSKNINERDMQSIANELNATETAFVYQLADDIVKVRFFTPVCEVNLCGHATIATFYTLANKGYIKSIDEGVKKVILESNIGKLPVELNYKFGQIEYIVMQQDKPKSYGAVDDIDDLLFTMNLNRDSIGVNNIPSAPEIISTGAKHLILPIKNKSALDKISIDSCALRGISEMLNIRSIHAFYLPSSDSEVVYARNFSPRIGIDEEPATGTASGSLIYYLKKNNIISSNTIISLQGESLNRPSKIYCFIEKGKNGYKVKVGGNANIVMEGILKY